MIKIPAIKILFVACISFLQITSYATMEKNAKIWVTGHKGLVGSAIVRSLEAAGYTNLLLAGRDKVDLCDENAVNDFYAQEKPDYVFIAAAKVGGILANNSYPADFISTNLSIERNLIHGAYLANVKKLLFLGSSCIYPRECPQPIKEDYLLTGPLEPTNEWYAVAKIAGVKLCQAYSRQYGVKFISLMPTNLYGPGDNFDLNTSHVLPALIRKFVEARDLKKEEVVIWGSGKPLREFLYVDDLAEAAVWAMNTYEDDQWLNVGTGKEITILGAAHLIAELTGYKGRIVFDASKPDGMPRKLLDVSKINSLGWKAQTPFRAGLEKAIQWYEEEHL